MIWHTRGPQLIRCSSKSLLPAFLSKRLNHNLSPGGHQSRFKKWTEYIAIFSLSQQSDAFKPMVVSRVMKSDKLDPMSWKLIYHDFATARISVVATLAIAGTTISMMSFIFDYLYNGKFTLKTAVRLQEDAEELGNFMMIPGILLVYVVCALWRFHSLRIVRLYQSTKDPQSFIMVKAAFIKFFKQVPFNRSQVTPLPTLYKPATNYFDNIRFGNVRIANRSNVISLEAFCDPVMKSYVLGERDVAPSVKKDTEIRPRKPPVKPPAF